MNILERIVRHKRKEIAAAVKAVPLARMRARALARRFRPRGFKKAVSRPSRRPHVIAEIKKRSPSRGLLARSFDPVRLARAFESAGAAALSVLTDLEFFGGRLETLSRIRQKVRLPILRKDFIIDEYQVYESAAAGADAILLIAAILTKKEIRRLKRLAERLGLDVLLEIHSAKEFEKIRGIPNLLVGINNRDLRTFRVSLETTEKLMRRIPKPLPVVSESGIRGAEDLTRLKRCGVRAVLVGEGLVTQRDPRQSLKKLIS